MRQELRDRSGWLVGWREQSGNRIDGRSHAGRLVGWYDPHRDETRDYAGRLVGRGDLLAALITSGL